MRILHVATELFPLLKVGGLGDVLAALPLEQERQGDSVRILLPGFRPLLDGIREVEPQPWAGPGRLLLGRSPSGLLLYLLDIPELYARDSNPYAESGGSPRRFVALALAARYLASLGDGRGWKPDVVHAHDWPAGLVPAHLASLPDRPRTVMTIHNAAYQGLFPADAFPELGLPDREFSPEGVEFHQQVSLLKAGLLHADKLTTVSPTFADELKEANGGMGLEGIYAHRAEDLVGILNGVDSETWNPARDPALVANYDEGHLSRRALNKRRVQVEMGLTPDEAVPLFGVVSRFDSLKGLDLLLENLDLLDTLEAQLVVLGHGDPDLESRFLEAAALRPKRMAVALVQDEGEAHRIFAGADFILVPSRYEPCGLTQMYAQRYGAVPVVRRSGGLADTVVDLLEDREHSTGLVYDDPTAEGLGQAMVRACALYREDPGTLLALQRRGMAQDFGWSRPARAYHTLYRALVPQS